MQANYSEAELLTFISKVRKRKKIRRRSFKPSKSMKLGIFTFYSCSDSKEMYKKACCTCRVVVLPLQPIPFFWRCGIFKGDVTRDNSQRRVLAQHRNETKRCRNNVISSLEPSVGASGHQSIFGFNGTFVTDKYSDFFTWLSNLQHIPLFLPRYQE